MGRESDALFEDKVRNCKKCKTNGLLAIDTCVQQTKKVNLVFLGYEFMALAQCLASHLWDPGKSSMVFSVDFQASKGKKLQGKNHGNNYRTRKFDAKHSATDCF